MTYSVGETIRPPQKYKLNWENEIMVNMLITYQLNDGDVIEINHPEEFEFKDLDGNSLGNAAIIKRHNNDLILAEAAFVISART